MGSPFSNLFANAGGIRTLKLPTSKTNFIEIPIRQEASELDNNLNGNYYGVYHFDNFSLGAAQVDGLLVVYANVITFTGGLTAGLDTGAALVKWNRDITTKGSGSDGAGSSGSGTDGVGGGPDVAGTDATSSSGRFAGGGGGSRAAGGIASDSGSPTGAATVAGRSSQATVVLIANTINITGTQTFNFAGEAGADGSGWGVGGAGGGDGGNLFMFANTINNLSNLTVNTSGGDGGDGGDNGDTAYATGGNGAGGDPGIIWLEAANLTSGTLPSGATLTAVAGNGGSNTFDGQVAGDDGSNTIWRTGVSNPNIVVLGRDPFDL